MSREQQIEEAYVIDNEQIKEMADFLWRKTLIHTEDLCHDVSETCYNAGYRKQSEVAREIFAEIEDSMSCFEDDDDGYLLKKCEFEFFMRELKKKIHGGISK